MGTNESKIAVATPRPEPDRRIRNEHLYRLIDPRSPSTAIDRTPIQVDKAPAGVECDPPVLTSDPRSPSPGITRTPMKDVMRATVRSLARRLSMLFLNDGVDTVDPMPPPVFSKLQNLNLDEELESSQPLAPLHPSLDLSSDNAGGQCAITPARPSPLPSQMGTPVRQSPVFHAEQVAVEIEAKQSLDEVGTDDDDDDLSLNKDLSLSLLTCHNGVVSSQALFDDTPLPPSPLPCSDPEHDLVPLSLAPDSAQPSISNPLPAMTPIATNAAEESADNIVPADQATKNLEESLQPATEELGQNPTVQACTGSEQNRIKRNAFNTQSPSQAVFKPQWLGVGFGVAGVRARAVQGRGKGGSSPLPLRGVLNAGSENKGQMAKQKQRERCGKVLVAEGRSPLQILKEKNSPRGFTSQKLKTSTPDRMRLGQVDRRALSVSLDKENQ